MNNKHFYEDEPNLKNLSEKTFADLADKGLKGLGAGVRNTINFLSKNPKERAKFAAKSVIPGLGTYKDTSKNVNYRAIYNSLKYKMGKDIAKDELSKLKFNKKNILDKINPANKTTAGNVKSVLALGMASDLALNKGENTKKIAKNIAKGTESAVKNIAKVPQTALSAVTGVSTLGSGALKSLDALQSQFQSKMAALQKAGECAANPSKCNKLIAAFNAAKNKLVAGGQAAKNASPAVKAGAAVVGVAAAVVAAKAIKDALEKKDWYNKGCNKIEDPEKKKMCLSHVQSKVKKELQTKLNRCKYANNPDKCVEIITAKIKQLG